jgi:hypothetical protein
MNIFFKILFILIFFLCPERLTHDERVLDTHGTCDDRVLDTCPMCLQHSGITCSTCPCVRHADMGCTGLGGHILFPGSRLVYSSFLNVYIIYRFRSL